MERKVFWHLRDHFPHLKFRRDWTFDKVERTLHFSETDTRPASEIHFMSCDSGLSKFWGETIDVAALDEECEKEIKDQCLIRLMARKGDLIIGLTPEYGMSWSFDEVMLPWNEGKLKEPDLFVNNASMYENPFMETAEIEKQESAMCEQRKQVSVYGKHVSFEGQVFNEFRRDIHVVKRFSIPPDWAIYRGIDWGYVNQFACVFLAVDPKTGSIYAFDEIYEAGLIPNDSAELVLQRSKDMNVLATWADAEDAAAIALYNRLGVPTLQAGRDKMSGIWRIKALMKLSDPHFYITENCVNFINEIIRHRFKKIPQDFMRNRAEKVEDAHNHLISAAKYVVDKLSPNLIKPLEKKKDETELFWESWEKAISKSQEPELDEMFGEVY